MVASTFELRVQMRNSNFTINPARLTHSARLVLLVFMCTALAGCNFRPKESLSIRALTPTEAVETLDSKVALKLPTIARRQVNILALSGGGADGAFGAGVLNGWSSLGTRPNFDIVTGVSTGALMAALAFLGPQYDGVMRQLYTTQTNRKIFRSRGVAGILSDSLYDYTPLKKQIERIVTRRFLNQIAEQHARGRRLYVATTNLDAGTRVIWDMGEIASGDRHNAVLMFQKVLRASAAIPGFFKPVYIKPVKGVQLRQAHVDGGLKEPILVPDFVFKTRANTRRIYLVVNGRMSRFEADEAVKPELADIARKSITELTRSLLDTKVYQGYVRARNSGTKFHLVAIPDNITPSKRALDFDPKRMRKLYLAGYAISTSKNPWQLEPPRLQKFDRIASARVRSGGQLQSMAR